MKKCIPILLLVIICSLFVSCEKEVLKSKPIQVIWKINSIEMAPERLTHVTTTIINNSLTDLRNDNWTLNYNHMGGGVSESSLPAEIMVSNPNGDYFTLAPTSSFATIRSGEQKSFQYAIKGYNDKMSEVPVGMFIVIDDLPEQIELAIEGVNDETMSPLNPTTAATRHQKNARLTSLPQSELLPFIPRPRSYQYLNEDKVVGSIVGLSVSEGLENEIAALTQGLTRLGISARSMDENPDILIALENSADAANDAYQLRIDKSGISVIAATTSGIYYGIQSLLQYIEYAKLNKPNGQVALRGIEVSDQPRFDYRGLHLDVSRNFHSVKYVKRLLEGMASFKLNKFQFHITDDEGWRLEIKDLPELTEFGSKRGYTKDEKDHLRPSYGSGYDPQESYGSGYYTRSEFINILKYANDRHIEVITEIDVPGHSRAAIKSMEVRYDRLIASGDKTGALQYRLADPDDQSEYRSAQNWHDNVICVCQDGAYNFMEKVLEELASMYQEANAPMTTLHIGGDETPYGAWQKSPICSSFIKNNPAINNTNELTGYFFKKMQEINNKYNLVTGGWEEITLQYNEDAHNTTEMNLDMLGGNVRPYVWNAIIGGGRDDMAYRLANAGFEVVMSNSSSFYFDMAYDRDPDEIGLSWSGYADTEKAFETEPFDLFFGNPVDGNGVPLSKEYLESRERITKTGRKNFIGIQAQLWSETILNSSSIEYLMYPKLLGFSERAWASEGAWTHQSGAEIERTYERDWNLFANTIGQKTLLLLDNHYDGIQYRVPEPGATIEEGMLKANTAFPGLKIMYQIGAGPALEYTAPVSVKENAEITAWCVTSKGRAGRKTEVHQAVKL